ncbi:carbohydrate sulfotransferase 1-like [Saccostrea echinata]|uniref:carbohydrate sulfotransferase 1-like n=1 Tax=Saccostrea echinata TaxID=191078 RepID=UPI002A811143|nr:carbohydrate sulfotransferase 1-like [Saccostrea echinata]
MQWLQIDKSQIGQKDRVQLLKWIRSSDSPLVISEKDLVTIIKSLRIGPVYCSSETKPVHLSDSNNINTPMRLIVAYMRSGSTLTADLVRHIDGDFYMFEPLHGITQAVNGKSAIQFLNGTKRTISREELETVYAELLYNWFTCNFGHIDMTALTNRFIAEHTPELGNYYRCINPSNTTLSKIEIVRTCIWMLRDRCVGSGTRTIKTIRLSVFMAGKLLEWLPKLKIIHLIRDPRGTLQSQFTQLVNEGNLSVSAKELCSRISLDLSAFEVAQYCHKDRIMSVIYENLCQNPLIIVQKIYNFLEIKYTKSVKDYVTQIMKGPVRLCDYCTNRGNSVINAYRWISTIPRNVIQTIDDHCSFLYSKLGYLNLDYENLANTTKSWQPVGYKY